MSWSPQLLEELIFWMEADRSGRIYDAQQMEIGIKDLSGNGNHMYWNKPQQRLEAFFRRIVKWLDKYIWKERQKLTVLEINFIGNRLANKYGITWEDMK